MDGSNAHTRDKDETIVFDNNISDWPDGRWQDQEGTRRRRGQDQEDKTKRKRPREKDQENKGKSKRNETKEQENKTKRTWPRRQIHNKLFLNPNKTTIAERGVRCASSNPSLQLTREQYAWGKTNMGDSDNNTKHQGSLALF